MNCQTFSKVFFMFFVVLLAIYLLILNKPSLKVEKYANKNSMDSATLKTTIIDVYKKLYGEKPSDVTLTKYMNYFKDISYEDDGSAPVDYIKRVMVADKEPIDKSNLSSSKTTDNGKTLRQKVNEIYKELYGSLPSDEEAVFYVKFFKDTDSSPTYMKEIISSSAPTLKKTLKAGTYQTFNDTLGTEDEVIAIYNQILDRNPDEEELQYYATFIKQGPQYVEKMKLLLLQSQEYARLQKLQKNSAYGQLLGGLTDRQITLMVKKIYADIAGKNAELDDDTLKFLKKKLLEFQLDEGKFRKFVKNYVLFNDTQNNAFSSSESKKKSSEDNSNADGSLTRTNSSLIDALEKLAFGQKTTSNEKNKTSSGESTTKTNTSNTADVHTVTTTIVTTTKSGPQKQTASNKNQINTADIVKQIQANAKCQFDKDALEKRYNSDREKAFATLVNERNKDELKNTCVRNKAFSPYHFEDMVLLPGQEWSVPQKHPPVCINGSANYEPKVEQTALIGTLLTDAHKI